jgi:hypothetical protein
MTDGPCTRSPDTYSKRKVLTLLLSFFPSLFSKLHPLREYRMGARQTQTQSGNEGTCLVRVRLFPLPAPRPSPLAHWRLGHLHPVIHLILPFPYPP